MNKGTGRSSSLEELLAQYDRAKELSKLGLSYPRIGEILGINKTTIGAWIRGARPQRVRRHDPDLSPSPDLAYLVGFYLGDGRSAGREKKVRFKLADRQQIEYVNRLVARILKREAKPIKMDGPFYVIDYDSVVLGGYLDVPLEKMKECVEKFSRPFLRGFFDAEGYASAFINFRTKRINGVIVGAANTNVGYLEIVMGFLSSLGIESHLRMTNKRGGKMTIRGKTWLRRNDVYHVVLQRPEDVKRFCTLVGFRIPAKKEKLVDLANLLDKPPRERYVWFMSHYRKEGRRWVKIRREG